MTVGQCGDQETLALGAGLMAFEFQTLAPSSRAASGKSLNTFEPYFLF